MTDTDTQTRKRISVEFLKLIVAGHIEEAYKKYVDMKGKHHNLFFPAGFPELQKAMKENEAQFPHKQLTVKNVIGDGDIVAVHSHLTFNSGQQGMVVVHIMKFRDDKIVEFWDCGQAIPEDLPNKDGAL